MAKFVDFTGETAARVGQQPRLDRGDLGTGLPAGHRQALPGQPDAGPGVVRQPAGGSGISYTEFSYVLLQSLDYLELFRTTAARCRPVAATSGATSPPASS